MSDGMIEYNKWRRSVLEFGRMCRMLASVEFL
jgi:hypothetical protein